MITRPPSRLVTLSSAAAQLGTDVDGVLDLVARGAFAWVFNVATGTHTRELRILRACLDGQGWFKKMADVIAHLAPGEASGKIASTWLAVQWQVSRATLKALHDQGEMEGRIVLHRRLFTVGSVRAFLARRLVTPAKASKMVSRASDAGPHPGLPPSPKARHIATAANGSHRGTGSENFTDLGGSHA